MFTAGVFVRTNDDSPSSSTRTYALFKDRGRIMMRKDIAAAAIAAALVAGFSCTVAQATTIGYYMDMSNISGFPAGNYAKVLISDLNPTTHVNDGSIIL